MTRGTSTPRSAATPVGIERRHSMPSGSSCVPGITALDTAERPLAFIKVVRTHSTNRALDVARELNIPLVVLSAPGDPLVRSPLQREPFDVRTEEDRALFASAQASRWKLSHPHAASARVGSRPGGMSPTARASWRTCGGTKLSQGDLALANICGSWPEGREQMQSILDRWRENGYDLDWLLRNVNAIVTGEARFVHLHDEATATVQDGLTRAERSVDHALNLIAGRLGLDHDRVLFGRYVLPVMSRYIDRRDGHLVDATERDRLLHWYFQSALWGRFSGSTETTLDQDFEAIEDLDGGLDRLLDQLRLWHGSLRVEPEHFRGWSLGARFYPVLYAMTRVGEARDWGTGLVLRRALLGRMKALEVHHIFPKALLYRNGFHRSQVNAVSNFCFLTKDTNLQISDRAPSEYFREIEERHPGALASQWIPIDEELWETEHYPRFLDERQRLLAAAANELLGDLLHDETWAEPAVEAPSVTAVAASRRRRSPAGSRMQRRRPCSGP